MKRGRDGSAAVNALVVEHRAWAVRVAEARARKLRNVELDDAIGEAMVALVSAAKRWRPGGARFQTFAYRRIVGAVLDLARFQDTASRGMRNDVKAGREPYRPVPQLIDVDTSVFAAPTPQEDWRVHADLTAIAAQEIAALPPKLARVARWRLIEGLKLKEIGNRLGLSEARACQIWKEARRFLISRRMPPMPGNDVESEDDEMEAAA